MKNLRNTAALVLLCTASFIQAQNTAWPEVKTEMKPAARWWWLGSAVDQKNLDYNIAEYASKGMGMLEVTPIYGVKNNEANDIQYLSPKWMGMLDYTIATANKQGMKVDMNNGTGWPFGGPKVSIEDAATKVIFEEYELKAGSSLTEKIEVKDAKQKDVAKFSRLMAFSAKGEKLDLTAKVNNGILDWKATGGTWRLIVVFEGKTFQKVKRAAPGGEGYVMNHFSKSSVANYFANFTKAFEESNTPYPNSFFNDSYEVYGGDWTSGLFEEFEKRRGYKLEMFLPEFIAKDETRSDITARVVSDYRETLAELLLENFTQQWKAWANAHGATIRNQAHGSPGNMIDLYATVDIPECESFGISDFQIKGLRIDSITRENDSDLSMLKYASSGAHLTGKTYTSSETFTWLTEHFRTSLSQCKPDLDLLFLSGVNHIFFHGTTYSPQEAKWPGWKFYASIDMSPTNNIWRDVDPFFDYITRCQSFLQEGKPDNDFLLYFPVYDLWHEQGGRFMMFDIHKMAQRAPRFISSVNSISNSGYDVDYISDHYLTTTSVQNGKLITEGGTSYKAIIIPGVSKIPAETMQQLLKLAKDGAKIIFVDQYPDNVPGFGDYDGRKALFDNLMKDLPAFSEAMSVNYGKGKIVTGKDYAATLKACNIPHEDMRTDFGLHYIRRSNVDGYHYFISALQEKDTEQWIPLTVNAESIMIFDPVSGRSGVAKIRKQNGRTEVFLQLKSGESLILKTFDKALSTTTQAWGYYDKDASRSINIDKGWSLSFVESIPQISGQYKIDHLGSWTEINNPDAKRNMGAALYSTTVTLKDVKADNWQLDLGDVRESARVRINGKEVATLWSVPYRANVGEYLKKGKNLIEVEVTNLPANRIADYDRNKVEWKIFKEINFVKQGYLKGDFSDWGIIPSGLLGPVMLTPLNEIK